MAFEMPQPTTALVAEGNGIKVHSFVSPEMLLANATYVVEGPTSVIVIDGQFVAPVAMGFRGFAESFGKPISRVYLTHEHVDHWFGLASAFSDLPIHALPETIDFIREHGEDVRIARKAVYGDFVPESIVIPGNVVTPGQVSVDGIELELVKITNAECANQLCIGLPQVGALVVGDLVYGGAHVYVVTDTSGWISELDALAGSSWQSFLPGHGQVADAAELRANASYLAKATTIASTSADVEAYKAAVLAEYPDRSGAAIIDIYAPALFGQAGAIHE